MKFLFILLGFLFPVLSFATIVSEKLYLNRGVYTAVDASQFSMFCFNGTATFSSNNPVIRISTNDTLRLKVINTDSISHGFDIKYYSGVSSSILPGDSVQVDFFQGQQGCFIYFDNSNNNNFAYSGAGGMIVVTDPADIGFFWTIKDLQNNYNDSIANGVAVDWNTYYPNYFTINGKSNPDINSDTDARVTGNVGDTIYIFVANTGHAAHSLHFHGYHSEIVFSSKFPGHVGRNKDTFPIYEMETLILRMVPDKTGEYPVHDHNLVAVTGGMIYPTGMFLTMLIN